MLSPLDKTICVLTVAWLWVLKRVSGYISVWVFPHFDPSCEFFPTELKQSGPVIHLFHSPYAIVIALVQCWFFIRHLFPMSPGLFSFIRPSLKRQCKASRCHWVPPGKNSFYSERVISRQNWDHWGDLRRNSAVLSLCLPLSSAYKYISKHPMPKAIFEPRQKLPSSLIYTHCDQSSYFTGVPEKTPYADEVSEMWVNGPFVLVFMFYVCTQEAFQSLLIS